MSKNQSDFHERLKRLDQSNRQSLRFDRGARVGLYDLEEEKRRKRNKFRWKRLVFCLFLGYAGFVIVKAYIANDMGEEAFQARVAELETGDRMQQLGAKIVKRGPAMILIEKLLFDKIENAPAKAEAPNENENSTQ